MEKVLPSRCSTLPSPCGLYLQEDHPRPRNLGNSISSKACYSVSSRLCSKRNGADCVPVTLVVVPVSCGEACKSMMMMPVRCSTVGRTRGNRPSNLNCRAAPELSGYDALDVEDGCGSDRTLQFLEETDERILSERVLNLSRSNKVRSALELFSSMEVAGLKPSPHACNSLISCILRNASFDDALRVFEVMRKKDIGTGHTYSLILREVASARGCGLAFRMFEDIEREEGTSNKRFDVVVYNTMISVCAKQRNWSEAERMWRKLKENGLNGTLVTYSLLVSTFVQCGQMELALAAYCEMIETGYEPGEDVMKALISSCTKEGKWVLALQIFERMLENGIRPNIIVFNAVINCLGKVGEADHAFRIYDLLKSSGHSPDTYTWNALLNALYRCKRYADCIRLFENISKLKSSEINVHLYNTALMSCQRLGLWDRSLQFLWQMEATGMQMSTATYNLVINSCENARKPKVALEVYHHMIHKKIPPDTFTYLTLIRACVWGSLWTDVEYILEHVEPNVSLYNALIHGFCLRGKITLALKLYGKMRSNGLKPDGKTRALMLQHIPEDSFRYHPRYVNIQEKPLRHNNRRPCR